MDVMLKAIDNLVARRGRMLEGVELALQFKECDSCYIVSARGCGYKADDLDKVVRAVRAMNSRNVCIHTVGIRVDPIMELLLRRIADGNNGKMTIKQWDEPGAALTEAGPSSNHPDWRNALVLFTNFENNNNKIEKYLVQIFEFVILYAKIR